MARLIHKFSEVLGLLSRGKFETRLDEELRGAIETLENAPSEKASATPGSRSTMVVPAVAAA